jgi:hypothetical protein
MIVWVIEIYQIIMPILQPLLHILGHIMPFLRGLSTVSQAHLRTIPQAPRTANAKKISAPPERAMVNMINDWRAPTLENLDEEINEIEEMDWRAET